MLAFGFTCLWYMSGDPVVTIAEVLPLRPSRTIGDVGHKYRSEATQLGKNLSHSIPWIWLEAIIRCITKAVGSSCENFIDNEGTLPFWFELVLFLLWEA